MSNDNSSDGMVMMAFILGALTGAGVALLLAPASGEETREYLGQKAREGRARARDAVEHGREVYQNAVEQGREVYQNAVEQGREVYQTQRDSLTSAVERGREAYQQARERGEQKA